MSKDIAKHREQYLELLLSLPIFKGAEPKLLEAAVTNGKFAVRAYGSGDMIYCPEEQEKRMIVFLSGKANVYSADTSRAKLLRTVVSGGVVGVANLFSAEPFVSRVIADKSCKTLEISAKHFGKMLEKDKSVLYNYISFLSDRICFLNRKIVYLTAGSAERKLAHFLVSLAEEQGCDSFELPVNMNSLAEMLNLGRASLYRAADKLESDGLITREGKKITVISKEKMLTEYEQ